MIKQFTTAVLFGDNGYSPDIHHLRKAFSPTTESIRCGKNTGIEYGRIEVCPCGFERAAEDIL